MVTGDGDRDSDGIGDAEPRTLATCRTRLTLAGNNKSAPLAALLECPGSRQPQIAPRFIDRRIVTAVVAMVSVLVRDDNDEFAEYDSTTLPEPTRDWPPETETNDEAPVADHAQLTGAVTVTVTVPACDPSVSWLGFTE